MSDAAEFSSRALSVCCDRGSEKLGSVFPVQSWSLFVPNLQPGKSHMWIQHIHHGLSCFSVVGTTKDHLRLVFLGK